MLPKQILLVEVKLPVCSLCLTGAGGECHVPGCAFWMNDAPSTTVAAAMRERGRWW
jgi:hypothetical protein